MTSQSSKLKEPIRLTILHTNDMHGRLEAMARLSTFAREQRENAQADGRVVFFWDAGDAADRRIQICSATKGAAFPPILNAMGYTLQTMGNAISLTYGPQAMSAVSSRSNFPILAANCRDGDSPLPDGLQEQVQIPLPNGVTMGVIGLTAPWGRFYELFGLNFPNFIDLARNLVGKLRKEGVAIVVVLSHLGLEDDRRLADAVEGIDLIIGAHSHDRLQAGEERNGVLIVQAGEFAEALGRVDLTLDLETSQVLSRSATVLDVRDDTPPDPYVLTAISIAEKEVSDLMSQHIGELDKPLELDHFRECGIGNITADALRERMGAEAAIVSSGQFHQALPAGAITFGQLNAACFSTANPWLSEVRGKQIIEALERGLDLDISKFKHPGHRGTPIGIPQISGMVVEYDVGAKVGARVRRVIIQGKPIEPELIYRLAHTDAEVMPDVGYLSLEEGQTIEQEVPTILREVIEDYVRKYSPVPQPVQGRWLTIPPPQ